MLDIKKLSKYQGMAQKPSDFNEFWRKSLEEMNALPMSYQVTKVDIPSNVASAFHLWFTGVSGARIHCQLITPKNMDKSIPHRAIIQFHGYHTDSGDYQDKFGWAAEGFVVLALDARGQGGLSEDTTITKGDVMKGLVVRGIEEGPENLYFRRVFLDTAQAARILMGMPYVDEHRVFACGASQGGGLAIACASLVPSIYGVQVSYPFLSDYREGYALGADTSAFEEIPYWFRFKDPLHKRESDFFDTLEYIDIQNLAPRIKGRVYWSIGLSDTIVPPPTQFATYNKIRSEKHMIVLPEYGHEYLPKVSDELRWFFFS